MSTATENKLEVMAKPAQQAVENIKMGFDSTQGFALMQRAAQLLCQSTLVPKQYIGNLPNCVVAMNMANRIGADPLMVMQNLYVVHGNPSWSAQFVIACFNQCGRFTSMRFRWANKPTDPDKIPDNWACMAYATEISTGEVIEGPTITIKMAKKEGWYAKSGSKWQSIPELMLMYRAGAWLQRTHAPDISMGLRTAEEEGDIIQSRQDAAGAFVVDAQAESQASVASKMDDLAGAGGAAPPDPADEQPEADPSPEETHQPTMTELIKGIATAATNHEVAEFLDLARGLKREDYRKKVNDAGRERIAVLQLPAEDPTEAPKAPAAAAGDGGLFGDGE